MKTINNNNINKIDTIQVINTAIEKLQEKNIEHNKQFENLGKQYDNILITQTNRQLAMFGEDKDILDKQTKKLEAIGYNQEKIILLRTIQELLKLNNTENILQHQYNNSINDIIRQLT